MKKYLKALLGILLGLASALFAGASNIQLHTMASRDESPATLILNLTLVVWALSVAGIVGIFWRDSFLDVYKWRLLTLSVILTALRFYLLMSIDPH